MMKVLKYLKTPWIKTRKKLKTTYSHIKKS